MPEKRYYISDPTAPKGFRQVSEEEWQCRPAQIRAQSPSEQSAKTCKIIINNFKFYNYLNGYAATIYQDEKFYCNYLIPDYKNYTSFEIENVVCGSLFVLYGYNEQGPLHFDGAEPLEKFGINGNTYLFKVADQDMTINVL